MLSTKLPKNFEDYIEETFPPTGEYGIRPFWTSDEAGDLIYENGKFISRNYATKADTDVAAGTKGFMCLGCEPGSNPQPFVVIGVDNERKLIELIYPYVYITQTRETGVVLKVGGDAKNLIFPIYYDQEKREKLDPEIVERQTDYYLSSTYDYEGMKDERKYVDVCLGSFGNVGLPTKGRIEYVMF